MELTQTLRDRDRVARAVLAAGLAVVAFPSLTGKRLRGALAGVGALALGYSVSAGSSGSLVAETLETGTAEEGLRCAVCDAPIVAREARTPDEGGEMVHEACLGASA